MTDDHLQDARREIMLNQGWVEWHYSSDLLEQGKRLHKCELYVASPSTKMLPVSTSILKLAEIVNLDCCGKTLRESENV